MLRRALKFWNSPRQRSRRVNGPCVRKWYFSAAAMASVRIKTPLRTRAGRRHELRVPVTEAAQAPGRRHALLVADKAAIRASARSAPAINCAPRIVLRVGWSGERYRGGKKGKHRQEQFHAFSFSKNTSAFRIFSARQATHTLISIKLPAGAAHNFKI
jgi:hypothetical protein